MSISTMPAMTAEEFVDWAMRQPETEHYELVAGRVVAMSPERSAHGLVKGAMFAAVRQAIRGAGLPCQVYTDSMAVRVDATTVYEPDVVLRCGPPVDPDAVVLTDPLIVAEVVSRSSRRLDTELKLRDYFRIHTVSHYVVLLTDSRSIVHHRRDQDGVITTQILPDGKLHLDPPGITVADLFVDLPAPQ